MNADAYFEMGASHVVCQDYALAGTYEDLAFAAVCDGCSSSPHTDVGSRLLCHVAKDTVLYLHSRKLLYSPDFLENDLVLVFKESVIRKVLEIRSGLRLQKDALDSTLLVAAAVGDRHWFVICFGDGYVFQQGTEYSRLYGLEYSENAPFYLTYDMFEDKREAYRQVLEEQTLTSTCHTLTPQGLVTLLHTHEDIACTGLCSMSITQNYVDSTQDAQRTQAIVLMSDGIATYESNPRLVPQAERICRIPEEVARDLSNFPNPVGKFVERRMRTQAKTDLKANIVHQDDVACAAIYLRGTP